MSPETHIRLCKAIRRIHDQLAGMPDAAIAALPEQTTTTVHIQPSGHRGDDTKTIASVDALGNALLGHPGQRVAMGSGAWHYDASGCEGPIQLGIYMSVSSPEDRAKDQELARLRAEVESLRASNAEEDDARGERHDRRFATA